MQQCRCWGNVCKSEDDGVVLNGMCIKKQEGEQSLDKESTGQMNPKQTVEGEMEYIMSNIRGGFH